jgi:hypothetical protein
MVLDLQAAAGHAAQLTLAEGKNTFAIVHRGGEFGTLDFIKNNLPEPSLRLDTSQGREVSLHLKQSDPNVPASAVVHVEASAGKDSTLLLAEGANSFAIVNDASDQTLKVVKSQREKPVLVLDPTEKHTTMTLSPGAAADQHDTVVDIIAAESQEAILSLGVDSNESKAFMMSYDSAADMLAFTRSGIPSPLVTLAYTSPKTTSSGSPHDRATSMTIHSGDGQPAAIHLNSGGISHSIVSTENNGLQILYVNEPIAVFSSEVLSVNDFGATSIADDCVWNGASCARRLRPTLARSSMLTLNATEGQDATLELLNSADQGFSVKHDGASQALHFLHQNLSEPILALASDRSSGVSLMLNGAELERDSALSVFAAATHAAELSLEAGDHLSTLRASYLGLEIRSTADISIAPGLGYAVNVDLTGGESIMKVDDLEFHGSYIRGTNRDEEMQISSEADLMLQAPGQAVRLAGRQIGITGEQELSIASQNGAVTLSAAHNKDVSFGVQGGALLVDSLKLDGNFLSGNDAVRGLNLRSAAQLRLESGPLRSIGITAGADFRMAASRNVVVEGENILMSTRLNSDISIAPNGGSVTMSQVQISGPIISAQDSLKPFSIHGDGGVVLRAAETKPLSMYAEKVHVAGRERVAMQSKGISLQTAWNGDIGIGTDGGAVKIGGVIADGSVFRTDDVAKPLSLLSRKNMQLDARLGTLAIHGEALRMTSNEAATIAATQLELSSAWNQPIVMSSGEGVFASGIHLDGSSLKGSDVVRGLKLQSPEDLSMVAHEGVIALHAQKLVVDTKNDATLSARTVHIATHLNNDIQLDAPGGSAVVDAISLSGTTLGSRDASKGLHIRSSHELHLSTGVSTAGTWGGTIALMSEDISIHSRHHAQLTAGKISLESHLLNSHIRLEPNGGTVALDSVNVDGTSVQSHDELKGLRVTSDEDVLLKAGKTKGVKVMGDVLEFSSRTDTRINGGSIKLQTGWNAPITLDAPGGDVRVGNLQMGSGEMHSVDEVRGLQWRSTEDIYARSAAGRQDRVHLTCSQPVQSG